MYKPDFVLKTNLPPIPEPDLHIPEEQDVKRLLQKIEGKWLEVAVLLGACAGMRRSEICGLKFSDINLDKNTVQVRRTVVKDSEGKWIVQERTKTVKSKREIELPGFIIAKLWNQPRESEFVVLIPTFFTVLFSILRTIRKPNVFNVRFMVRETGLEFVESSKSAKMDTIKSPVFQGNCHS